MRGLPIPDWAEEPVQYPGDDFYLSAFMELSTCRQYQFGPVPWTAIIEYAEFAGLDSEILPVFVLCIRAMDSVYLDWIEKKKKTQSG